MHPGLLEIGANPQDNAQLLYIHTDLFQRLLEKHQQVDLLIFLNELLNLKIFSKG